MKERIALISVLANIFLALGKIIVGVISKSASVLAEGIHSGMDVFSSGIAFFGIRIAKKPVDAKHPYGYYKYEVLAGLAITIILFLTGIYIIYEAYQSFLKPSEIVVSYLTLGVMLFSALVNEVMARLKIHYGKKENAISLISDGVHSRVDVFTSIAVLVGLLLIPYFAYADSLLALLIGIYIIKESFSLGKETTDSLLDVSAGKEVEDKIKEIAKKKGIMISDLKTQKKGSAITANMNIELPNKISVEEATKTSEALRKEMMEAIKPLTYVAIQIQSHDISSGYYKPSFGFGMGYGWQRRGQMKTEVKEAQAKGPGGFCVCPKCGYKTPHKRGTPCATLKCPKCNVSLTRD